MSHFSALPEISDRRFKDVWVNSISNTENCGICVIEVIPEEYLELSLENGGSLNSA